MRDVNDELIRQSADGGTGNEVDKLWSLKARPQLDLSGSAK